MQEKNQGIMKWIQWYQEKKKELLISTYRKSKQKRDNKKNKRQKK